MSSKIRISEDQARASRPQFNISGFLGILCCYRWWLVLGPLAGLAISFLFLYIESPNYTASGALFVDPRSRSIVNDEIVQGVLGANGSRVESQLSIIASDDLIRRVVGREKLAEDSELISPYARGLMPDVKTVIRGPWPATYAKSQSLEPVARTVRVKSAAKPFVLEIEASSKSPAEAARIVNARVQAYMYGQTAAKTEEAKRTNTLIDAKFGELLGAFPARAHETPEQTNLSAPVARTITPSALPGRLSFPSLMLFLPLGLRGGLGVALALALFAYILSQNVRMKTKSASRTGPATPATVDSWPINLPDQHTALATILTAAEGSTGFTVFTLNLDHLVKLRNSADFRHAYNQATFVTADGEPVARLARKQDVAVRRTTGADLVLPLAMACAKMRLPIFLFGTSPGVLAAASQRLQQYAGEDLEIVGSMSPPIDFDPKSEAADAAIDRIKTSGARICFVALGAPKQEIFAARAVAAGTNTGFICIGAGLDFLAGEQIRAPRFFQTASIEWVWRLGSSPRRLAARYAQCAVLLARLTLIEPLFHKATDRRQYEH